MTYKLYFEDTENGIIVESEQKTFKKLIKCIKEYLIENYNMASSILRIIRVNRYGTEEILVDGSGLEVFDLIRLADEGID